MQKAKPSLGCLIGDGSKASFWFDNWCTLGPIYNIAGRSGPSLLGISIEATVAEASTGDGWTLPSRALRNSNIMAIRNALLYMDPPSPSKGPDEFVWGIDQNKKKYFSTKATWNHHFRPSADKKTWASAVWAKHSIPKHVFIFWVALLDRLPVRSRFANRNGNIHSTCCFCNTLTETRDLLLLHCSYSEQVWHKVTYRLSANTYIFGDWSTLISWLRTRTPAISSTLKRNACQATIYFLWRERNNRLHNSVSSSSASLFTQIDQSIKDTLLARRLRKGCGLLLSQWFARP